MTKSKKVISHIITIMMLVTSLSVGAQIINLDKNEAHAIELTNKKIYCIKGYKSGNCVVSSNMMMLRRAAILSGSSWKGITLSKVKKVATLGGSTMKWKYTFKHNGMTYTVKVGFLSGKNKKKKLKKLLKDHPEGIVVYGASSSGPHAVLATEFKGNTLYAAEPNYNARGRNKGITKYSKTSMRSIQRLTQYWYVTKKKGTPKNKFFKVKFHNTDGKGKMPIMKIRYKDGRSMDKNLFTYKGHKFKGWNAKRASDKKWLYTSPTTGAKLWREKNKQPAGWELYVFKDKQRLANTTKVNKDTIHMYAVWK